MSICCYSQNDGYKDIFRPHIGLQFRGSMNSNDTISKRDFSLFVMQFGVDYNLTDKRDLISLSPNIYGKLGFFFFLTTGAKAGLTIGINDRLKTDFPVGLQFSLNYDFNLNKFNKNVQTYHGWCPETSLTIRVSEKSLLRFSYGLTIISNNNDNHVHNITIGVTGLGDF